MELAASIQGSSLVLAALPEAQGRELAAALAAAAGAFLAVTAQLPRQFDVFTLAGEAAPGGAGAAPAIQVQVLQILGRASGGHRTAYQIADWDASLLAAVARLVTRPAADSGAAEELSSGEEISGGEWAGLPPVYRMKELNVSEKVRLAMKATRSERQVLIRDNSPQVYNSLLSNPRIEDLEVLAIVRSPYVSSGILQRVADTRQWISNYDIQLAIVRNPKTPAPLALRLLETLRPADLAQLAKGGAARDNLRQAALRLHLARTSGRKS
ncbi:MAG: hypothetical protein HYV63_09420 [Candidatus Schekmanbacteria bacterium]|nr:hypothetical protein [Candidatus Schekmanbacteria bacterium]